MLWLYNIGIKLYGVLSWLLSPFNSKAALFSRGRKHVYDSLAATINPAYVHVWFHFASLGEFEQGRPALEKIKAAYPKKRIVITFFSPSGYEVRKNYALADGVFYLPLDSSQNARKFIAAINPEIAVFTKYEYWYHYYKTLQQKKIPVFIISGIFRKEQIYFKWYGSLHRSILGFVEHFFVQNEESKALLSDIGLKNSSVSGDTRFDRVYENAGAAQPLAQVTDFCTGSNVLVAGSTWEPDERLLASLIAIHPDWKFIVAPHEIDKEHITRLQQLLPDNIKYSDLTLSAKTNAQVLIIDNIGLLSSLYQYGNIAYIGGGFGAGIHNTLEAAAFGLPVIFGPKYQKFQEAKDLISLGAAVSISGEDELLSAFDQLTKKPTAGHTASKYVAAKKGATDQIFQYLKRYL